MMTINFRDLNHHQNKKKHSMPEKIFAYKIICDHLMQTSCGTLMEEKDSETPDKRNDNSINMSYGTCFFLLPCLQHESV